MHQKINKWNEWLHRNLFWVVVFFAFWITILIGLVGFGIWLGDSQRTNIQKSTDDLSLDQEKAIKEAMDLRKMLKEK